MFSQKIKMMKTLRFVLFFIDLLDAKDCVSLASTDMGYLAHNITFTDGTIEITPEKVLI
jgi:hypothetical protein